MFIWLRSGTISLVPVAGSLALVVGFCVGDIAFGLGLVADGGAIHAIVSCHGSTSFLFFTLAQKEGHALPSCYVKL